LGRIDGKVVFVPFVLPGEEVACTIVRERPRWCEAELLEILNPSPIRRDPFCSHFRRCGGCHFQHIPYEYQLRLKEELFSSILSRHAGIDVSRVDSIIPSPGETSWRARARLAPCPRAPGATQSWGFYQGRSHDVMGISSCPMLKPSLGEVLGGLNEIACQLPDSSFLFKKCIIETGVNDTKRAVLYPDAKGKKDIKKIRKTYKQADFSVILCQKRSVFHSLNSRSEICFYKGPLAPEGIFSPPGSFFQANLLQNKRLVALVIDFCKRAGAENILEFFSGSGNFSIPLVSEGFNVTAVESDGQAVKSARMNLEGNQAPGQGRLHVVQSAAEGFMKEGLKASSFDAAVLDPPRSGAAEICRMLARGPLKNVVYVSCDPMTLARDIAILASGGFGLSRATPVDMFPNTYHMESVSLLRR